MTVQETLNERQKKKRMSDYKKAWEAGIVSVAVNTKNISSGTMSSIDGMKKQHSKQATFASAAYPVITPSTPKVQKSYYNDTQGVLCGQCGRKRLLKKEKFYVCQDCSHYQP